MGECGFGNVGPVVFGGVGHLNFFNGIEIPVFFGSDEWRVRPEKSDAKEKWLISIFAHKLDRFGCDHAIGLLFVCPFGREPTQGSADFAVWF